MKLREKADEIFAWGLSQRTDSLAGGWENHSRAAAKVAETIAEKANMDAEKAYAMGLLHDIGRCMGVGGGMNHTYVGYKLCVERELSEVARICLTHSFNPKEKVETLVLPNMEDTKFVQEYVKKCEYDEYDRLIQLVDFMAGIHGITTIERRFCSVLIRHGLDEPREILKVLYKLKGEFDEKCGVDVYELFPEEIAVAAFRGIPGSYGHEEIEEE